MDILILKRKISLGEEKESNLLERRFERKDRLTKCLRSARIEFGLQNCGTRK